MNDKQIRIALRNKVFRHYRLTPSALVLEEVGIRHGAARVDFLVVNGLLHGFELKSDRDNLSRLENQIQIFSSTLDRVTLVVGYRLVDKALRMVPEWWGVKLANLGKRGAIHFRDARTPKNNPCVEKEAVVKLLWQDQALQVLEELGADVGVGVSAAVSLLLRVERMKWSVKSLFISHFNSSLQKFRRIAGDAFFQFPCLAIERFKFFGQCLELFHKVSIAHFHTRRHTNVTAWVQAPALRLNFLPGSDLAQPRHVGILQLWEFFFQHLLAVT